MDIRDLGDSALLVELGPRADDSTAAAVQRLLAALHHTPLPGITDLVPSYTTIGIHYDPSCIPVHPSSPSPSAAVRAWVHACALQTRPPPLTPARHITIPVCYGGPFGPDLPLVAELAGLTPDAVIALHASALYTVRAIGFVPGFPYLAGLPPPLRTPRRTTPRTRVPAVSVGIGGEQTGIYPLQTPGGWHLIGRTPLKLFLPENEIPTLLQVGDRVRFEPITPDEFD